MKVLHINTATTGGAAIAAIRLHNGLLEIGVDSHLLTLSNSLKKINNHYVYDGPIKNEKPKYPLLTLKNWILEKIFRKFERRNNEYHSIWEKRKKIITPNLTGGVRNFGLFSYPDSIYDITKTKIYEEADIIHLHWVAGFLDYETFFKQNEKPIIWTLHDANPFLGGFHHKDDFERNKHTHEIYERIIISQKKELYSKSSNLTIISPSYWLAKDAKESKLFEGKPVFTIRNGIDFNIFQKRDKKFSRSIINLNFDKRVFLLASADLSDFRKGVDLILPIISDKEFENDIFLLVGNNFSNMNYKNVVALGGIYDEHLMSVIYSAADVFILPSRLDNLPNTMLESIACETPVISFDIGDNRDFIGESGCVVNTIEEMKTVLKGDLNFEFPNKRVDFELKSVSLRYLEIYNNLFK